MCSKGRKRAVPLGAKASGAPNSTSNCKGELWAEALTSNSRKQRHALHNTVRYAVSWSKAGYTQSQ